MNMKEKIFNKKSIFIIGGIALLHFGISFITDSLIFSYVKWDISSAEGIVKTFLTYGVKAVFLLLLFGMYGGIYYVYRNYKKNNRVRRFVTYSLIYMVPMLLLLLLTWPGIWRMDEFGILKSAAELYPVFWQNYLTSVFYILSLMLIPIPAGVIILQILLISCVVGYLLTLAHERCNHSRWIYLLYIPFLLLPVLDSNLYPMRMSIYAFLELLWVGILYDIAKTKREINKLHIFLLSLLAAVITIWRTEAIYYAVAAPVIVAVLFYKSPNKRMVKRFILLYLLLTIMIGLPQYIGNKSASGDQYDITSVVLPITPLVKQAESNGDREELNAVDRVLSIEVLREGYEEGLSGIQIFWSRPDLIRTDYTKEEYGEFKKAYQQLILKYPEIFIKERWETFMNSNGLLQNTTEIFTEDWSPNYTYFRENYRANLPVDNDMRTAVIKFIECRSSNDYETQTVFYSLFYNFIPPLIFLFLLFIILLVRRKWGYALLIGGVGAKVPLIFLTAPSRLFMYYYSLYVIGYGVFFYLLFLFFTESSAGRRLTGSSLRRIAVFLKKNGIKEAVVKIRERLWRDTQEKSYEKWLKKHLPSEEELEEQRNSRFSYEPLISILVPAYETKEEFLKEMVESVLRQTYGNFELCIADGSSSDRVESFLSIYKDDRIRYRRLKENKGISGNTNEALYMARGEFITLLDHDDFLTANALYEVAGELQDNPAAGMLYTDEDKVTWNSGRFFSPHFKPDFDPELLRSNNYICHLLVVKRQTALAVKGFDDEYNGAQDYDFILKCSEKAGQILHIPKILYHWRSHEASTAENPESKLYAYEAGRRALLAHLKRMQYRAIVDHTSNYGYYRTKYIIKEAPDTNSKQLWDKIVQRWDFGQPVNKEAGYLLLQDKNAEVTTESIKEMVSICQREEVAIAGGMVVDGNKRIVFGGGFYKNEEDILAYPFRNLPESFKGYMNRLKLVQNVGFVSSQFCLIKKEAFLGVGGFTEGLTGDYAILDLCFRFQEKGCQVIYTPYAKAVVGNKQRNLPEENKRKERKLLSEKWEGLLNRTAPYYNKNLSVEEDHYFMWYEEKE